MRYLIPALTAFLIFVGCDGEEASPGEVGAACDVAADCAGGFCLDELGSDTVDPITFEDGYCTSECEYVDLNGDGYIDYDEYVGCTEDGLCLIYDSNPWDEEDSQVSYCFQTGCITDWDCRDSNYICMEFGQPPWTPSSTACVPLDVIINEEYERASYPGGNQLTYPSALVQ